jgi:hypothetical protein
VYHSVLYPHCRYIPLKNLLLFCENAYRKFAVNKNSTEIFFIAVLS